jgi:hypothetical protein
VAGITGAVCSRAFAGHSFFLMGVLVPVSFTPLIGAAVGATAILATLIFGAMLKNSGQCPDDFYQRLGANAMGICTTAMLMGGSLYGSVLVYAIVHAVVTRLFFPNIIE